MKNPKIISDAELEVIDILWQAQKPLSAYEIRTALNKTKDWERTTVLTLIRRLVEKNIITQTKKEVYYYTPNISREDYQKEETKNFIRRIYKGKTKDLVAALVQDSSLTKEDLTELRNFFHSDES